MNKEFHFVKRLVQSAPRSKNQINTFFLSDAEVLKVGEKYLCSSVDTIAEEISMGLVQNAKSLGWLAAIVSFSDLAAIGVAPQSLSINLLHPSWGKKYLEDLKSGVEEACQKYQVELTEYQSLTSSQALLTSTAAALTDEKPSLFRTPLKEGDALYLTGPLGLGNTVAFANVALRSKAATLAQQIDDSYRPIARIKEALSIKNYAHACLDTSDGGLFSFDLFAMLNGLGIEIEYNERLFHPLTLQVAKQAQVNPFIFFAAQNGEFELLFAVSPEKEKQFLAAHSECLKVGRVVKKPGLSLRTPSKSISLDLAPIQNLLYERIPADQYILALIKFASSNQIEAV